MAIQNDPHATPAMPSHSTSIDHKIAAPKQNAISSSLNAIKNFGSDLFNLSKINTLTSNLLGKIRANPHTIEAFKTALTVRLSEILGRSHSKENKGYLEAVFLRMYLQNKAPILKGQSVQEKLTEASKKMKDSLPGDYKIFLHDNVYYIAQKKNRSQCNLIPLIGTGEETENILQAVKKAASAETKVLTERLPKKEASKTHFSANLSINPLTPSADAKVQETLKVTKSVDQQTASRLANLRLRKVLIDKPEKKVDLDLLLSQPYSYKVMFDKENDSYELVILNRNFEKETFPVNEDADMEKFADKKIKELQVKARKEDAEPLNEEKALKILKSPMKPPGAYVYMENRDKTCFLYVKGGNVDDSAEFSYTKYHVASSNQIEETLDKIRKGIKEERLQDLPPSRPPPPRPNTPPPLE